MTINHAISEKINLECKVQGKEIVIYKPNGSDNLPTGPEIVSVTIESVPEYLSIQVTGVNPFMASVMHFKNNESLSTQGIFDSQTIRVVDNRDPNLRTTIDLNRLTGMITVSEKIQDEKFRSMNNYSGNCRLATIQKF